MSSRPLVSVVTIFLNAQRFIEEAIESVFAQTCDRWELLLVDDGSTDASTRIARHYAQRNPQRVRYLEHEGHRNRGMSASRNLGIRHAGGEYVAFLDSDDVWLPHKLEHQVGILETHPSAGMICGAVNYWRSWTGTTADLGQDIILAVGAPQDRLIEPPELLRLLYPLGTGTAPCPSDLLFRRQALDRVRGFEEQFVGPNQMYEDQALLSKIYLTTPVFVSSACCLKYRLHPESCVSVVTGAGRYHAVRRFFLEWFDAYLVREKLTGTAVWQMVQKALWPYRHPVLFGMISAPKTLRRYAGAGGRRLFGTLLRQARFAGAGAPAEQPGGRCRSPW